MTALVVMIEKDARSITNSHTQIIADIWKIEKKINIVSPSSILSRRSENGIW